MARVVGHEPGRGSRALCEVTRLISKCSRTHCKKNGAGKEVERRAFLMSGSLLKSISQVNFTQHGAFETHFFVLKQTTTALFLVLSGLILIFCTQFSFFCTFNKSSEELLRMHCGSAWYGGVILIGSIRLNVHLHPSALVQSCGHWITFTHVSRSSHTLY